MNNKWIVVGVIVVVAVAGAWYAGLFDSMYQDAAVAGSGVSSEAAATAALSAGAAVNASTNEAQIAAQKSAIQAAVAGLVAVYPRVEAAVNLAANSNRDLSKAQAAVADLKIQINKLSGAPIIFANKGAIANALNRAAQDIATIRGLVTTLK